MFQQHSECLESLVWTEVLNQNSFPSRLCGDAAITVVSLDVQLQIYDWGHSHKLVLNTKPILIMFQLVFVQYLARNVLTL